VIAWSGLYAQVGGGRPVVLAMVGALPAAAALTPRARGLAVAVAVALAVPLALALATRGSLWDVVTLDGDAWAAIRGIVPGGLAAGSEAALPVSPVEEPALVALLDVAMVLMAAAAAWQIVVRRRPVLGVAVVAVALAYRWTVEPPASGAAAGASALVAVLLVLALSGWGPATPSRALRHAMGAVVLGGITVFVATALAAGPAQAGDPWWAWKQWDVGGAGASSGGGLDLRQRYPKLDWPRTPQVALTVVTDRARPLRAAGLSEFDGIAFAQAETGGSEALPIEGGAIVIPGAGRGGLAVTQAVTLVGATSRVVLASGRPERILGSFVGPADLVGDAVRLGSPLRRGDRYLVQTRIPQPRPTDLVNAAGYDATEIPVESTRLRAGFWSTPIDVPLWGSAAPPPDDEALGPYAAVRDLAREVVGDAATPYAAVNRVEAHLRANYVYDEQPPYPTSLPADASAGAPADAPPLVDFLLSSRRGFCQHFAGSMAVMLRSVGIPARVAVGYTGGRYDSESESWRILDRDAHSWVEVYFPGYGWLAFDPTPGRSASNPASVSSPDYAPTSSEIDLGGISERAIDPPGPGRDAPTPAPEPAEPAATRSSPATGGGIGWRWALLALVLPASVAPARRALRRLRGRRGGDERARVVAATRELEASLASLGLAPSPTASSSERAHAIRARTGVDAAGLYRRAAIARFAPAPPAPGEAAAAWRELARVRREIRRGAPRRRRLMSALGIRRPARATVR
jgi:hypothetical protein